MNFIATILDDNFWNPWGISWISSLFEFVDTKAKIIVVNRGLSGKNIKKLIDLKITVLPSVEADDHHNAAVLSLSKFDDGKNNKYLYCDSDLWFQLSVDELFENITDDILICKNQSLGLLGLSTSSFRKLKIVQDVCNFTHDRNVLKCVLNHFPKFLQEIDNKYNCTRIAELKNKNGMLVLDDVPQHTIHFQGMYKGCSSRKNLLYHERYPDLFSKYVDHQKISATRIIKSVKNHVVNHNLSDALESEAE